ncbi:MAG: hypothetical protein ABI550_00310 [Ignavibacteriaceae bacterium]
MSNNFEISDLIYAYALGCLDKNEASKFKEFLSNEDTIFEELGEFQNLAALMTSILNIDVPNSAVKNKVAEKLYSLSKKQVEAEKGLINADEEPSSHEIEIGTETEIENNKDFETPKIEDQNIKENIDKTNTEEQEKQEEKEIELNENINNEDAGEKSKQKIIGEEKFMFGLDEDFLPKRKEPEKFRFEEVEEQSEKVQEDQKDFIEKFIEQNRSSITEKIDKTIEGFSNEAETDIKHEDSNKKNGYELVKPLIKKMSIFLTEDQLADNEIPAENNEDDLTENTLEESIEMDSLKSQSLQRVFIQKESKTKFSLIVMTVVSLLFLASAVWIYFTLKANAEKYKVETEELKKDLATLYSKKETSNSVIDFLESPNVTLVELGPTDWAPNSSGKLYINFGQGRGYLYTKNLPVLPSEKGLQLWFSNNGKFISLGIITSNRNEEYYPFNFKPLVKLKNTEILVTEEKIEGAKGPISKLLLIGAIN